MFCCVGDGEILSVLFGWRVVVFWCLFVLGIVVVFGVDEIIFGDVEGIFCIGGLEVLVMLFGMIVIKIILK